MSEIKILSIGDYKKLSTIKNDDGTTDYSVESLYQTYEKEVSKAIAIINAQTIEIEKLKTIADKKKKMPKAFDHATDKKVRAKAVKMLNDRYTVKATALALGISESTVNRIKKAENLVTPITKKKK